MQGGDPDVKVDGGFSDVSDRREVVRQLVVRRGLKLPSLAAGRLGGLGGDERGLAGPLFRLRAVPAVRGWKRCRAPLRSLVCEGGLLFALVSLGDSGATFGIGRRDARPAGQGEDRANRQRGVHKMSYSRGHRL